VTGSRQPRAECQRSRAPAADLRRHHNPLPNTADFRESNLSHFCTALATRRRSLVDRRACVQLSSSAETRTGARGCRDLFI